MSGRRRLMLQPGWVFSLIAMLFSITSTIVMAAPTWSTTQTAGRLGIIANISFLVALLIGSGRMIGITTVLVFAAAIVSTVGAENPAWIRAFVVGVLWYLAAETGWEAIDRRDGVERTARYNRRRLDEANTVVMTSLGVTLAVILLASIAPVRSFWVVGFVLVAMAGALVLMAMRFRRDDTGTDH